MAELVQRPKELTLSGNIAENWRKFKRQWDLYSDATEVEKKTPKQQVAIFLNVAGVEATELYDSWETIPADDLTLKAVTDKFQTHCQGVVNIVIYRYKFWSRNQKEGEKFINYYQELRTLIADCEYGELKNDMLRDKICVGIRSDSIRERIFREKAEITLMKVLQIIESAEVSRSNVQQLQEISGRQERQVHAVRNKEKSSEKTYLCKKCNTQHGARNCPAFGKMCFKCNGLNHYAECCSRARKDRSSRRPEQNERRNPKKNQTEQNEKTAGYSKKHFRKVKKVHHTYVDSDKSSSEDDFDNDNFVIDSLFVENEKCENDLSDQKLNLDVLFNQEITHVDRCNDETTEWYEKVKIDDVNKHVNFKLDTGAEISILPVQLYEQLGKPNKSEMCKAKVKISTYNRQKLNVIGCVTLVVEHKQKLYPIEFYIVDVKSVPILGLKALITLQLVHRLYTIQNDTHNQTSSVLLEKYKDVFTGLGEMKGEYDIQLKEDSKPVIYPLRRVPESIKPKLKECLNQMEAKEVITKVDTPSDWVNSLVIVEKPDGTLRICLDPRELNKSIKREHYQIPTLEDIQAKLNGANYFTSLDCSAGYWQVKLSEDSSMLTTFNTPFGRYRFLRMPFGISSAQEVFQKKLNQILEGIPGVVNYIDDILIYASTEEEHDNRLQMVLQKCGAENIKLKKEKCYLKQNSVKYLGHIISSQGMQPDPEKVEAIRSMPSPEDKQGVQRLLGLVNWLARFIPNASSITEPIRSLMKKDIEFQWNDEQERAFTRIKDVLTGENVLKYYDVNEDVTISVDASKSGLGAVLLQSDRPVAFSSRALTPTEQNYAQIEKECLAVVYGCEKFHQYVYGKEITIENDHKPLEAIFRKPLAFAPPRIQRMLIRLQKYDFEFKYKQGKELWIADALSRAYLKDKFGRHEKSDLENEVEYKVHCVVRDIQMSPRKQNQVEEATKNDPEMKTLIKLIQDGWPDSIKKCHVNKEYYTFREELSVCNGIVMKGSSRIVIPRNMRSEILQKLHTGHWGIERTRRRAREIVFWPGISQDIESMINKCDSCQKFQNSNPKEKIKMHEIPKGAFEYVGTDLFYYKGADYLLIADYYSKFWDIMRLPDTKSSTVIRKTKSLFSKFGIPAKVMSDNGPQFSSEEYKNFSKTWNFTHVTSSPNFPQSNGFAERMVQTAKKLLKKCEEDGTDPYLAILEYRNTPISSDLGSPAQLLQSRRLRSVIPTAEKLLKPEIQVKVRRKLENQQFRTRSWYNRNKKNLTRLRRGDKIRFQKNPSEHFRRGEIVEDADKPRSYIIKDKYGNEYRRNRVHISRKPEDPLITDHEEIHTNTEQDHTNTKSTLDTQSQEQDIENTNMIEEQTHANTQEQTVNPQRLRSSKRCIVKPVRFRDENFVTK